MQSAAVGLATGQAKLRRQNVSRTFVSLGRRNQNLLNRQLEFIDDLERSETDPDTLQDLFRLDHLATRMRRNAENLLVLAGEQTPRRWAKPIALRDVIQAAASEIADYSRVQIGDIDDATVSGSLATDISHLVAELLENAATFSPPTASIEVVGQSTPTHYRLAIMDQGIGMDDGAIAQANHRLANPVDFADAPSAYIGLFVVGHLARQLGVRVRLTKGESVNLGDVASGAGTIAFIDLPNTLLSDDMAHPIELPARAQKAADASINRTTEDTEQASYFDDLTQVNDSTTADFVKAENDGPAVTFWDEPVRAEEEVVPEPVEIPTAPVTEAGFPKRQRARATAAVAAATSAPVESPDTAAEEPAGLTAAGFPKRTSASADSAPEKPQPAPVAPPAPSRDAAALSNSLLSFKDAVKRGREEALAESTQVPSTPPSLVPPTQVAQPTPSAPAPQPVAPAQMAEPTARSCSTARSAAAAHAPMAQPTASVPAARPVAPPQPAAPAPMAQPTAPVPAAPDRQPRYLQHSP